VPQSGRGTSDNRTKGWNENDGFRLRVARRSAGHTQMQCARELLTLGADSASQPTVSQWERGKIIKPTEANLSALRTYISMQDQPEPSGTTPLAEEEHWDSGPAKAFDAVARQISGEPLLTQRQGALVDAYIQRLQSGPPLSDADVRALKLLGSVLGLTNVRSD
jgi:transcriptional regulator with XRE-family HTH domain